MALQTQDEMSQDLHAAGNLEPVVLMLLSERKFEVTTEPLPAYTLKDKS